MLDKGYARSQAREIHAKREHGMRSTDRLTKGSSQRRTQKKEERSQSDMQIITRQGRDQTMAWCRIYKWSTRQVQLQCTTIRKGLVLRMILDKRKQKCGALRKPSCRAEFITGPQDKNISAMHDNEKGPRPTYDPGQGKIKREALKPIPLQRFRQRKREALQEDRETSTTIREAQSAADKRGCLKEKSTKRYKKTTMFWGK